MNDNKYLIEKLSNCIAACQRCSDACLDEDNVSEMAGCIRSDRDCAEICQVALNFLSRNSDNTDQILSLCKEMCEACADDCEQHEAEHCKKCAEACRECAEACEKVG